MINYGVASCFYRYSLVDVDQLIKNLMGDRDLASRAVEPTCSHQYWQSTGKQTSGSSLPSFVMVVVRESDSPVARQCL